LSRPLGPINGEDVLLVSQGTELLFLSLWRHLSHYRLRGLQHDASDEAGQIQHVDSGNSVATVTDARKSVRSLEPGLLEVLIEDALSVTVSDSGTQHVHLQLRLGVDGGHGEGL